MSRSSESPPPLTASSGPRPDPARTAAVFVLAWALIGVLLSVFPYEYRDSDSSCYSSISQKLAFRPLRTWIAPEWWGHGENQGLFRDHPPGIFWLPALLTRAGFPGPPAALWANTLYLLLTLFFIFKLVSLHGGRVFGWAAVFAFVLTPIFFQYLLRANQEHPLNLAVVAGLYGLARSRESGRFKLLFIAALIFAVFVKGMSALVLSLLAVVYAALFLRNRRTFGFLFVAHLIALGAAGLFEIWYRGIAHQSFWSVYFSIQGGRSFSWLIHPLQKIANGVWYAARAFWFSFPWFFLVVWGAWKLGREGLAGLRDRFLGFLLAGAGAIVVLFALSDRKADRYIFTAYVLLAAAGSRILVEMRPKVAAFIGRRERVWPIALAGVVVVSTFLRIFFHSHLYRFIRLWPG